MATSINFKKESAKKIDKEKLAMEARLAQDLRKVFRNMADDAANLYKANEVIDSEDIAQNYRSEFLIIIRNALRKGIKKFGFSLRDSISKKYNIEFDIETKKKFIDLDLKQTVQISDELLDENVEQINNEFNKEATLFIANESEQQVDYITETNQKELEKAVAVGVAVFTTLVSQAQQEVNDLLDDLIRTEGQSERAKIERRIRRANIKINELNKNRVVIIADEVKKKIIADGKSRSELISSQNVGLGEAWGRNTEAQIIDEAGLVSTINATIRIQKEWVAILDNVTRESHARADGQQVMNNEPFIVGGEALKYPRDPNGSAGNIINCRCIADYEPTEI